MFTDFVRLPGVSRSTTIFRKELREPCRPRHTNAAHNFGIFHKK